MDKNWERYTVATNMVRYGGSFVVALGKALILSDEENERRIKEAFPEYWGKYSKIPLVKGDFLPVIE